MKTNVVALLVFCAINSLFTISSAAQSGGPEMVKTVISSKKIWLLADEVPLKCLMVKVKNDTGKTVVEKCFNANTTDWSVNIENLPEGNYSVEVGNGSPIKFNR